MTAQNMISSERRRRSVPEDSEDYLLGRAEARDGNHCRNNSVLLTEVAPSNYSIIDVDGWKMPIDNFTSKIQGPDYKNCSKRIKAYYKAQDELINCYETLQHTRPTDITVSQDTDEVSRRQRRIPGIVAKVTFGINFALMVAKAVASALSGSIAIISSLVDSVVDLLSGVIMWWASRAVKKRNIYIYPQGRTKLEPVAIIILSVVMAVASLQIVRESVMKIVSLATDSGSLPLVEIPTFAIAGSTIVIKFIMWAVYRKLPGSTVQALAQDSFNDVLSNTVAIVCGYLGSQNFQNSTNLRGFVYVDPAGAIAISFYIIFNWWRTGKEQIELLTGHTASPNFLSKLTWICLNHHKEILKIDTVRAFHFGNNFLVEVDIVLPEEMPLKEAHDIGESLQQRLESQPEVERAFVHLDYEYEHKSIEEHKMV